MVNFASSTKIQQNNEEIRRLYDFIKEGEHQQQDFKFRIDSSQKIAKTLVAFANTDGGRLLIGVKDNGRIAGIDPEEEFYMIEGASKMYCKPEVKFTARAYELEDKKVVLEISVIESKEKPHLVLNDKNLWRTYIRQNDENFEGNRVIAKFLKQKAGVSKRKNLIAYGPEERLLFDYLSENATISLSKFCRIAKIPVYKAEKVLVLFLKWEVIDFKATEKGILFYLL